MRVRYATVVIALLCVFVGDVSGRSTVAVSSQATIPINIDGWLESVRDHSPGANDPAAKRLREWSKRDLDAVVADLKSEIRGFRQSGQIPVSSPLRRVGISDEQQLNRLLKRGALLHADVAMQNMGASGYNLPTDNRAAIVFNDGQQIGSAGGTFHWEIGRLLLDLVQPRPSDDSDVQLWYRATSAFLQGHEDYSEFKPHVERARQLFPKDAVLCLYAGSAHEAFGEPRIQKIAPLDESSAITPGTLPNQHGTTLDPSLVPRTVRGPSSSAPRRPVGTPASERQQADDLFRQAIRIDSGLAEAHIRRSRLLALQGKHDDAIDELKTSLASALPPQLEFYSRLFLGTEERTIGQWDAARTDLRRAVALYPGAQSAILALSEVSIQTGDRHSADDELQSLVASGSGPLTADPWRSYFRSHSPSVDELFVTLWDSLR